MVVLDVVVLLVVGVAAVLLNDANDTLPPSADEDVIMAPPGCGPVEDTIR